MVATKLLGVTPRTVWGLITFCS